MKSFCLSLVLLSATIPVLGQTAAVLCTDPDACDPVSGFTFSWTNNVAHSGHTGGIINTSDASSPLAVHAYNTATGYGCISWDSTGHVLRITDCAGTDTDIMVHENGSDNDCWYYDIVNGHIRGRYSSDCLNIDRCPAQPYDCEPCASVCNPCANPYWEFSNGSARQYRQYSKKRSPVTRVAKKPKSR